MGSTHAAAGPGAAAGTRGRGAARVRRGQGTAGALRGAALRAGLLLAGLAGLGLPAQTLPLPADALERSCWLRHTRERTRPGKDPRSVAFSNLRDGQVLRSPLLVAFAVRGLGVAPAGKPLPGTGHHHLLIDTPLPANVAETLPFNERHRHFGKGQTFATLDLPPGRHTLRLLFADHDHVPHFVYSPEIRIQVAGPRTAEAPRIDPARFDASCAAWYDDEAARPRPPGEWLGLANLRDAEPVASPLVLHFGVEGFGVCAAGQRAERSGHFVLEVLAGGRVLQTQDLRNGATQATLTLPNGSYQLRLRLVDPASGRDLLPPYEHQLPVVAQERM